MIIALLQATNDRGSTFHTRSIGWNGGQWQLTIEITRLALYSTLVYTRP